MIQVGNDKKWRFTLDPDLFASYCWTKSCHIFYIGNHRTPNVKKKGKTLKKELFELFVPLVFWRIFFFVVNAKKLKVLTDKMLLDRFFLNLDSNYHCKHTAHCKASLPWCTCKVPDMPTGSHIWWAHCLLLKSRVGLSKSVSIRLKIDAISTLQHLEVPG